jgi:hypothetical protein
MHLPRDGIVPAARRLMAILLPPGIDAARSERGGTLCSAICSKQNFSLFGLNILAPARAHV